MKKTILKHRFIYLFILLGLTVALSSCNSDDSADQTFLEKYDGSKWELVSDETIYIRINAVTNKLIEQWYLEDDCYYYDTNFDSSNVEVVENTEDKLVIKITDEDVETLTFTTDGDRIKVVVEYMEDGQTYTETLYLNATSIDVDNLTLCTT